VPSKRATLHRPSPRLRLGRWLEAITAGHGLGTAPNPPTKWGVSPCPVSKKARSGRAPVRFRGSLKACAGSPPARGSSAGLHRARRATPR
jgi:hypothetical protein